MAASLFIAYLVADLAVTVYVVRKNGAMEAARRVARLFN